VAAPRPSWAQLLAFYGLALIGFAERRKQPAVLTTARPGVWAAGPLPAQIKGAGGRSLTAAAPSWPICLPIPRNVFSGPWHQLPQLPWRGP